MLICRSGYLLSAVVITVIFVAGDPRQRCVGTDRFCRRLIWRHFFAVIYEGKATLYRSAQFFTGFCGYGALLFVYAVWKVTAWREQN